MTPQVGNIHVTFEELAYIRNECEQCGNGLVGEVNTIMNELELMFQDGWDSASGKQLAQELETMAQAHYENYRTALENYQRFVVDVNNRYAQEEETRKSEIRGSRLHQIS